jgi:hypothetical protein
MLSEAKHLVEILSYTAFRCPPLPATRFRMTFTLFDFCKKSFVYWLIFGRFFRQDRALLIPLTCNEEAGKGSCCAKADFTGLDEMDNASSHFISDINNF